VEKNNTTNIYKIIAVLFAIIAIWQFTGRGYKSDAELYRTRAAEVGKLLAEEQRRGKDNSELLQKQISDLRETINGFSANSDRLTKLTDEDYRILQILQGKLREGNSGKR
jgi:hypothetical protein